MSKEYGKEGYKERTVEILMKPDKKMYYSNSKD